LLRENNFKEMESRIPAPNKVCVYALTNYLSYESWDPLS
jgi:hypothetical protein